MASNTVDFAALASVRSDEPVDANKKAAIDALIAALRPWEDPAGLIAGLQAALDGQGLVVREAPQTMAAELKLSGKHVVLLIEPKDRPDLVIDLGDEQALDGFASYVAACRLVIIATDGGWAVRSFPEDEEDAHDLQDADQDLTADSWELMTEDAPDLQVETAAILLLVAPHVKTALQHHMVAVIMERLAPPGDEEGEDEADPETWDIDGDKIVKLLGEMTMMLRALIKDLGLNYAELLVQAQQAIAELPEQETTT